MKGIKMKGKKMKVTNLKFIPTELNFECWTMKTITSMKKQINFLTLTNYVLIGIIFFMCLFIAGLTNSYINHDHTDFVEIQQHQLAKLPPIEEMEVK